jgi:NTE family protein
MVDVPRSDRPGELALVMSGGGARAAYQVGFLAWLARRFPSLHVPILTGVSAGAINAAILSTCSGGFAARVEALVEHWRALEVKHVFKVGPLGLFSNVARWGLGLVSGGRVKPRRGGMVDTRPLRAYLQEILSAPEGVLVGIEENLRRGALRAVAITTSSYTTGQSITWVQGRGVTHWERAQRKSLGCALTVDHVLASAALPLLFPAVRIGDAWYGDGGVRLTAPLSPAVHLGAERILAISTRYARTIQEADTPSTDGYPPPAVVAGSLLNAVFLDQFDGDAERLQRANRLIAGLTPERREGLRHVDLLVLRPSRDLGKLANAYEPALPKTFRFLTRGFGTRRTRSNDFLSLVMFQGDYLKALLELGEGDAERHAASIEAFLGAGP